MLSSILTSVFDDSGTATHQSPILHITTLTKRLSLTTSPLPLLLLEVVQFRAACTLGGKEDLQGKN